MDRQEQGAALKPWRARAGGRAPEWRRYRRHGRPGSVPDIGPGAGAFGVGAQAARDPEAIAAAAPAVSVARNGANLSPTQIGDRHAKRCGIKSNRAQPERAFLRTHHCAQFHVGGTVRLSVVLRLLSE